MEVKKCIKCKEEHTESTKWCSVCKQKNRKWKNTPEQKAKRRAYSQLPKEKQRKLEYSRKPEVITRKKEYDKTPKRMQINRIRLRKHYQELRKKIINGYGGKCECCGERTEEFLTIDHISGNGAKHRKNINGSLYLFLKNKNFPRNGFRLLCYNCNCSRGAYGYCPHEQEVKS